MIHGQVTTRVQMGDDTAPDGVVSEDTINGLPSVCQSSTDDNEGDQGLSPVRTRRGMNNKDQPRLLHQSRFERGGDYKQLH